MTRKVFDNSMVAHVWAQASQAAGRSNNGQFYFDGACLYSYGSHFLVGRIMQDGVALMNADSYSVSTSRHQREAWSAIRHRTHYNVPDLTSLNNTGALNSLSYMDAKRRREAIRAHLLKHAGQFAEDSAVYLLTSRAADKNAMNTWKRIEADAARTAAKQKAAEAAADKKSHLNDAKNAASMSDAEVNEYLARNSNDVGSLRRTAVRLHHAHHAAKAAKRKNQAARVYEILGLARKLIKLDEFRNARRDRNRYFRSQLESFRHHLRTMPTTDADSIQGMTFRSLATACETLKHAPRLNVMARETLQTMETAARAYESIAEAEYEARREREQAEKLAAWLRGERTPSRSYFYITETLIRAIDVVRDDSGRITGGTLQTSKGADVPLPHAVRAFRFIKRCHERGEAWEHNGHSVRVGHFAIDRINADGSFVAGCHTIGWPEVERLARELDVFDLAATTEALEPRTAA
jgi:hypothetical protein